MFASKKCNYYKEEAISIAIKIYREVLAKPAGFSLTDHIIEWQPPNYNGKYINKCSKQNLQVIVNNNNSHLFWWIYYHYLYMFLFLKYYFSYNLLKIANKYK